MIIIIVPHSVVLLVVEPDSSRVSSNAIVLHSIDQVFALFYHDVVGLGGILLILDFEVVGGESSDGQVGSKDGSVFGHHVGSLSHSSSN